MQTRLNAIFSAKLVCNAADLHCSTIKLSNCCHKNIQVFSKPHKTFLSWMKCSFDVSASEAQLQRVVDSAAVRLQSATATLTHAAATAEMQQREFSIPRPTRCVTRKSWLGPRSFWAQRL